jgi:hypothetical protein
MRAKILASILLLLPFSTMAQHHHGMRHFDHYQPYRGGWGWVAPAVIGGAVVYGLSRPAPVVVQQQPVYVQQPTQPQQQVCEQKTFQQPNGQIVSGNFCYYK